MRTIGSRLPSDAPLRETKSRCDICGVHWHRSKMRHDRAGRLVCPSHGMGADEVEMAERVAADAARPRLQPVPDGGGNYDSSTPDEITHLTDGSHL